MVESDYDCDRMIVCVLTLQFVSLRKLLLKLDRHLSENYSTTNMVVITARGHTLRSMVKNFRDQLVENGFQFEPFDTITDNGRNEVGKLSMDLVNILSGNKVLKLLNHQLKKQQMAKLEPLNTVCLHCNAHNSYCLCTYFK